MYRNPVIYSFDSRRVLGLLKQIGKVLVLVIGCLLVYQWLDFLTIARQTLAYVKHIHPGYALLAVGCYFLGVYLFANRWRIVLQAFNYHFKILPLFLIIFSAIPINNFTPASSLGGESFRCLWLKHKHAVGYLDSFLSILYERMVEAIPITLLAIFGLYELMPFYQNVFNTTRVVIFVILALSLVSLVYVLLRKKLQYHFLNNRTDYAQLKKAFLPTLAISSLVWILDVVRLEVITLALDVPVSLTTIAVVSILSMLLGGIPLTPGGVGIVEGGMISALTFFHIPLVPATSVVFVERCISYFMAGLIGSICLISIGGYGFKPSSGETPPRH